MRVLSTHFGSVLVLQPTVFEDERGLFYESFNARVFAGLAGASRPFVQDNHSVSTRGVLRGLHYQNPHAQGKLIRCIRGEVFDVVVDIRRSSPTFLKWVGHRIGSENRRQVWVPLGFAHGFLTLTDRADVVYKVTEYWHSEAEHTIVWNDPALGIEWPLDGGRGPQVSEKDRLGRLAADSLLFE